MKSYRDTTLEVYSYFFTAYPMRSLVMILLMALAGLAEGVGVITLVPLLELADRSGAPQSDLGRMVTDALTAIGLTPSVGVLLACIVFAITVKAIILFLANRQVGYTVAGVVRDLRLRFLRSLLQVKWKYFTQRTPGRFTAAVTSEAVRAASSYSEACRIVASVFQMLAYAIVAAMVSWWIALAAALMGLTITLIVRRFFRQTQQAGREQTTAGRSLASRLVDVIQGIKPIKVMGREGLVWPLLEQETEALNQAKRREISASQTVKAFQEPTLALFLAVGLFLVLEVGNQPLTSTLLMAFIFYRLVVHLNTLQMRYQVVLSGESAFFSLRDEWEAAEEEREVWGGKQSFTRMSEGIRLKNLHFDYGEGPVLRGINAFFPVGSFIAIHGESGSGKTTLVDLIAGLHIPKQGRILVDGSPLQDFDLPSWRRSIGYVPQEMLLFTESIFLNVTLGDPSFSREDTEEALKLAGAWDFVQSKPNGLDQEIGHAGALLSGGQRQRIALARALVGRPSLLILDEVTTSLDPATEKAICQTLEGLTGRVTILSISHQEAMREAADLVFIMEEGKLHPLGSRSSMAT